QQVHGQQHSKPRIVVFATASGNPARTGARNVAALERYGAEAVLAPLVAPGAPPIGQGAAAELGSIAALVRDAQGIFFTGGDQARILNALRTASGAPNEVLQAIIQCYQRGGVLAGTSAGAAVMSRIAYRDAEFVLPTLVDGVRMGKEVDYGLGVMHPDWFIDQHSLIRGRFARSLVVMREYDFKFGLGIDENTALVIRGNDVRIVGYKGAILIDASAAEKNADEPRFHWKKLKLSYLDRGDQFNLKTRTLTPSKEKLAEGKIDPASPDFKPYYQVPLHSNDMLGNTTLIDMMVRLLDTRDSEGIGLAFDGHAARKQATPGFEFRLARGPGTVAWTTGAFGGEDTTVENVYLDVTPVTIGPLYPTRP
ncbi:MAG TPA: cyanophycinase, partial [Pirellulaceae bacterium]|nr:cyanophycinase [Pirellulaceae bacterium]